MRSFKLSEMDIDCHVAIKWICNFRDRFTHIKQIPRQTPAVLFIRNNFPLRRSVCYVELIHVRVNTIRWENTRLCHRPHINYAVSHQTRS